MKGVRESAGPAMLEATTVLSAVEGGKDPFGVAGMARCATAIEFRSADFSPHPSSPAKTVGSGLKSALLVCRNSANSTAVGAGGGFMVPMNFKKIVS